MANKSPYHPEYRAQAVQLVKTSGKSVRRIAADPGISSWTPGMWVRQAEIDAGERDGLTSEERLELQKLRREVWLLREERETLRKAAAFFAQESNRTQ